MPTLRRLPCLGLALFQISCSSKPMDQGPGKVAAALSEPDEPEDPEAPPAPAGPLPLALDQDQAVVIDLETTYHEAAKRVYLV